MVTTDGIYLTGMIIFPHNFPSYINTKLTVLQCGMAVAVMVIACRSVEMAGKFDEPHQIRIVYL